MSDSRFLGVPGVDSPSRTGADRYLGVGGLPPITVDFEFKPRAYQRAAHLLFQTVQFMVLVWHRRAGKTVFAVMELVQAALECKDPTGRFGYIAPLLKQGKSIAWDYIKAFARKVPGTEVNESDLQVTFPNGVRLRIFGADNPEAFRGQYFNGVVLDEPADMKPNVWGEILVPALADKNGWALFIGTPKGVNLLSQLFYAAPSTPNWGRDLKRWDETDALPPEAIEIARREMTKAQWAQEMECDFSASADNVLITLSEALEASRRFLHESVFRDEARVLGVDVARFGSDLTVIQPRQGKVAFEPKEASGLDTMQVVGQVGLFLEKWKPDAVFVDVIGIGAGVVDRLKQLGHRNIFGVNSGARPINEVRYFNKRIEMWESMTNWVKDGGCIPNNQALLAELPSPTYRFNNQNRMVLESKDELKARGMSSPDHADALAFTFAAPVVKSADRAILHGGAGFVIPDTYKPFGG